VGSDGLMLLAIHQRKCVWRTYVDMQGSEVSTKGLLLFDPDVLEVLVAEDDDAPLSDEEGDFVFLGVV
jgi:hypothetical protein